MWHTQQRLVDQHDVAVDLEVIGSTVPAQKPSTTKSRLPRTVVRLYTPEEKQPVDYNRRRRILPLPPPLRRSLQHDVPLEK